MRREITKAILFMLACTVLSCLVSIMALFIVGDQNGSDLQMLAQLQVFSIPMGAAVAGWSITTIDSGSVVDRVRKLYAATPQWAIFSAIMLNLLTASGEIALITDSLANDKTIQWADHVALISMMISSLAFCLLYGQANRESGRVRVFSGRW